MRIHRLRATAFGPFADSIDLDLEAVGASGLFLIHGPTGSGKTSLLDAICFALYAGVPGERRSPSLRSQHAPIERRTEVELEITVAGRRLRVVRHPAHERPKRRGTGTTTDPAGVRLEELEGTTWRTLSTRIDESAQLLDDLLGMGLEQFRRVVMLPQGDFAAFLRATDEERREVLERLFDISDYAAVEEELVQRRQAGDGVIKAARARLDTHLAHLVDVLSAADADLPEPEMPWSELALESLPTALDAVSAALDERSAEALTRLDAADRAAVSTRDRLDEARHMAALRRRGEVARSQLDGLEAVGDVHDERRVALARARAALAVLPHVEEVARAEVASSTAQEARAAVELSLTDVLAGRDVDAVRAGLVIGTEPLARAGTEVGHLRRVWASGPVLDQRIEAVTARCARAAEAVAAVQQQAESDAAALERIRVARRRSALVEPEIARLDELRRSRQLAGRLEEELRAATDTAQAARERAQDLRGAVQALVAARLDNMAGELAGLLTDGDPCAVCGSCEHPAPASAARVVTPAEIEEAQSLADEAEASHELARGRREQLGSRLDAARTEIVRLATAGDPGVVPHDLDAAAEIRVRDELAAEAAALSTELSAAADVEQRIAQSTEDLATTRQTLVEHESELASLRARRQELVDEIDERLEALASDLREHARVCVCAPDEEAGPLPAEPDLQRSADLGTVSSSISGLVGWVEATQERHRRVEQGVEALAVADRDVARSTQLLEAAGERLTDALQEHDVAGADEARASALPTHRLAALAEQVDTHERQLAACRATLDDDEVRGALQTDEVDLAEMEQAARAARAHADETRRRQATSGAVHQQVTRVARLVVDECGVLGPAVDEAALVRRVADLVTGTSSDNDKRMRLSTYVLAARLERIVELANARLTAMADGRYELAHDDSSARGQRRGGLGLLVRDLWTGQDRHPATLSGGESFTTSLALALGLADAIREESGGVELGTLFVDEGFGSLDQDSLEQVLDVLDGLRDGGRCVGVVSHVSEMRSRIPTQVRVDKTQHGSTVGVTGVLGVA